MYNSVKDYEQIDRIIEQNKDKYQDNAWYLDRLDSEIQRCFVIRGTAYKCAIVFDNVNQFKAWIEG